MQQSPKPLALGARPLGLPRLRLTPARLVALVRIGEWGLVAATFVLCARFLSVTELALAQALPLVAPALCGLWLGMLATRPAPAAPLGGYDKYRGAAIWALCGAFFAGGWVVAGWVGMGAAAPAAMAACLWRLVIVAMVKVLLRQGRIALAVVIAGGGPEALGTLERLSRLQPQGVRVLGLFDDRDGARSPGVQMGVPRLGRIADLPGFVSGHGVDLIIVTMPPRAEDRIAQILAELWIVPVDIRLAPYDSKLGLHRRSYRWIGDLALLDLFDRPLRARDAMVKRAFDLGFGVFLTALALPVMALIAVAIRADSPGPILFRQQREGYVGAPFRALKFRTLHHAQRDEAAFLPVSHGDARVTRIGRILRRSSLDELPQLFNVLKGDMSLVGPRPHAVGARSRNVEFAAVAKGYAARHKVRPGLTGLAQIRGHRGAVTTPEDIRRRLASDLEYIDRWSPWLDLRILAQTLPAVLSGENAY